MKYLYYVFLSLVCFSSCQKKEMRQNCDLIGRWEIMEDSLISELEFYDNGLLDNQLGFYTIDKKRRLRVTLNNYNHYQGYWSKYEKKKDSLMIYNLSTNKWDTFNVSCSQNRLTLKAIDGRSYHYQYIQPDTITKDILFDRITIFAPQRVAHDYDLTHYLSLNKDGMLFRYDYLSNLEMYKLDQKQMNFINRILKRINFQSGTSILVPYVKSYWDDSPPSLDIQEMTFVRDNELRSFYTLNKIEMLSAYIKSLPCRSDSVIQIQNSNVLFKKYQDFQCFTSYMDYNGTIYKYSDGFQLLLLNPSEIFSLWMLFKDAEKVENINFNETYVIKKTYRENDPQSEYIYTDGRYYKYKDEVWDIGINFLDMKKKSLK